MSSRLLEETSSWVQRLYSCRDGIELFLLLLVWRWGVSLSASPGLIPLNVEGTGHQGVLKVPEVGAGVDFVDKGL